MTEVREDPRLDRLVDLVVRLASGDLAARLEPSSARDAVDAVITGINLLADELEEMYQDLEQRVAERTAALDQAHLDLERMALSDSLTGLANRTLLNDRIQQAVARAERGAQPPAVLLLDLDEFKTINDSLGHGAGDAVLVEVARRLTSVIRDTDTVARLGGDEFAILMPDATEEQALRVAQRALKRCACPSPSVTEQSGPWRASACASAATARRRRSCCETQTRPCTPRKPAVGATSKSFSRRCTPRH